MIGRRTKGPNDYIVEPNGTTRIMLTQGHETIIDTLDYPRVKDYRWHLYNGSGKKYAAYSVPKSKGKATTIYMHNLIIMGGINLEVDHINGETLNNRLSNLRLVTHHHNVLNRDIKSKNSSGRLGVYWNKRNHKWQSIIMSNGKQMNLGFFNCFKKALSEREQAEQKYFGEFARSAI